MTDQQTDEPTDRQSSLYSRMNATKKNCMTKQPTFYKTLYTSNGGYRLE